MKLRRLSEADEARGYYKQELEVCEKPRFCPEIALTRLSLAELRDVKMQPALERALRHRWLLKA